MAFIASLSLVAIIVLALVLIALAFLVKMYQARRIFWRLRQQGIVCNLSRSGLKCLLNRKAFGPMASYMGPQPAIL